jgi:hypothetical protein
VETKKKKNLDEEELLLVDLLHAPKGNYYFHCTFSLGAYLFP